MRKEQQVLRHLLLAGTAMTALPLGADELPTGPSVTHGSVGIATPAAGRMEISQSTNSAIVNWKGFSIGETARVDIRQPSAASAMLNRVTGQTPSSIAGQLNANGQVFLVNPNGIAITPTGRVEAGAFVASTLDIKDDDFLAGRYAFSGDGQSAEVANHGAIQIGPGGYAALLGGEVENTGTVSVPLGSIGLGAGEMMTLDVSGDGFLSVAVPSDGETADALIRQGGRLSADGGRIVISAATARQAARYAVNLSGVAEARTVSGRSGEIVLGGGPGGTVEVSGRIDASAPESLALATSPVPQHRPQAGGAVAITGAEIRLTGADIGVSGRDGGGLVRIGGDYQGGGALPRARTVSVDAESRVSADALGRGDGGRVILWSDDLTTFDGALTARGGPLGGDGGFAEISGRESLRFAGGVDLSAAAGNTGQLLLDPRDIVIADFVNGVDPAALSSALETSDVTISTSTPPDLGQAGDITLDALLGWSSGNTLTLDADAAIIFSSGGSVDAPSGDLVLQAGEAIVLDGPVRVGGTLALTTPGTITTGPAGSMNLGAFLLGDGSWSQNGADLPSFSAADFFVSEPASFLRAQGGNGADSDPFLIADVYGLQGIDTEGFADSSFALVNDIDASGTAAWNNNTGFDPIGEPSPTTPFGGTFDGRGNTIDGLVINQSGFSDPVGLFGLTTPTAVIQNIGLLNTSIVGGSSVGGLVGENFGTVEQAFVTGQVTGDDDVGGLVGSNFGSIERTYSDATVVGNAAVGGLVGDNSGSISLSYARGDVTGSTDVGGLVGQNFDSIDESYATGLVSGAGGSDLFLGGLVGFDGEGEVTDSFWDVDATGQADSGGGIPLTTAEFQDTDAFISLAGSLGWDFEQDWAPPEPGFYPALYALEPVVRVVPADVTAVRGTQGSQTLAGELFGGPEVFVFGPAGDSLAVADTLASPGLPTSPSGPFPNVGIFPVTADASASSALGVTYRVVTTGEGALTVTPAPLTITALDTSKLYGTALTFDGTEFAAQGLVPGDTLSTVTLTSEGAAARAPVAGNPYPIVASDPQGVGLFADGIANYDITFVPGQLSVTPAPLIVTALDAAKFFGDALTFDGTEFIVQGLVSGDSVTRVALFSQGQPANASLSGSPYPITPSDPQGVGLFVGDVANYTFSFVPGQLFIIPASAEDGTVATPAFFAPEFYLPSPGDEIVYGGPLAESLGPIATAEEALRSLNGLAGDLDNAVEACRQTQQEVEEYLDCLGTALDSYASQIDAIALDLPEPLRGVSATIQQASREIAEARATAVRQLATARTPADRTRIRRQAVESARSSVARASEEIRKQIALIRADEPQLARLQAEQGDAITAALDVVGADLERAVGL